MAGDDNKQFFPSIFVGYRIGIILDPVNQRSLFDLLRKQPAE
jgi:hypothetical protein